jgi:hypothetical protein
MPTLRGPRMTAPRFRCGRRSPCHCRCRARVLDRQFPSGAGIVSRDAPLRALCERMIVMTVPQVMRSSGSPGKLATVCGPRPVPVPTLYRQLKTSKDFPEFSNLLYMGSWTFLTNHARVLLCVAHDPGVRLRDIAASRTSPSAAHSASSRTWSRPGTWSRRRMAATTATTRRTAPRAQRPARPTALRYKGSLTHRQPRASSWSGRTRKAPDASDSWAITLTSWR